MANKSLQNLPGFSTFKTQNPMACGHHNEAVMAFNPNVPTMHSQIAKTPTGRGIRQCHPWDMDISSFCAPPTSIHATPQHMLTTSAHCGLFTPKTPSNHTPDDMYVWDSNPCCIFRAHNRSISMGYVCLLTVKL